MAEPSKINYMFDKTLLTAPSPGAAADCAPPREPCAGGEAGPLLAAVLAAFDPGAAEAYDLVEAAARWARLAAWVAASEAATLAELASRPQMRPDAAGYRSLNPVTNTAVEIAGRCQVTARQAEHQVGHALQLVHDFPATHAALSAGAIDLRRARVITDELGGQDPDVRRRVESAVLPDAPGLDAVALRKLVIRLLHQLAPAETGQRHLEAREGRYAAVTPAAEGMAFLEALLSAEDATALATALNSAAADAKRADAALGAPARSHDQRRADALAELAWTALAACNASPTARPSGDRGVGDGDRTGDTRDHDRTSCPGARTAHATSLGARPTHATSPGARTAHATSPGARTTHATSLGARPARVAGDRSDGDGDGDHAAGRVMRAPVAHGAASPTAPSGASRAAIRGTARRRPVVVQVTVPFSTLIGLDDHPGELDGYGHITAAIARELAAAGVWTWLRTEPGTGQLLDHGRARYRPTAALADFIVARDRTCRAPGCHRSARACDVDHAVPFETGGPTSPANCHALCTTHHLLKHHGGWSVTRHRDGSTRWRSPTGHHYIRAPERIGAATRSAAPPG
ncbi:HNH endonuclease signature motif containing protein [Jiangella sp. DSM 45060]|uniref:HNH endonuclease signature motif containing protein n=1 Tax=Jiangella sp. DSM 45060 TaxID=1798224 RepID=UPI00087C0FAE|nr:HNH endonuclease signature motif containing protein [Jiangella sp. DSM 45060]SDS62686.1 protein of unknown function [Jiangella sp. DSM 45060]